MPTRDELIEVLAIEHHRRETIRGNALCAWNELYPAGRAVWKERMTSYADAILTCWPHLADQSGDLPTRTVETPEHRRSNRDLASLVSSARGVLDRVVRTRRS